MIITEYLLVMRDMGRKDCIMTVVFGVGAFHERMGLLHGISVAL